MISQRIIFCEGKMHVCFWFVLQKNTNFELFMFWSLVPLIITNQTKAGEIANKYPFVVYFPPGAMNLSCLCSPGSRNSLIAFQKFQSNSKTTHFKDKLLISSNFQNIISSKKYIMINLYIHKKTE